MYTLYYEEKDKSFYPYMFSEPPWGLKQEGNYWILREFPMYGGPALSEDKFKTFHEAFIEALKIT